jgi:hypothetical protein
MRRSFTLLRITSGLNAYIIYLSTSLPEAIPLAGVIRNSPIERIGE